MYSAYKLNKQGDSSIQPWCNPFLIWSQSAVPCPVLTVASWSPIQISQEAGQVVCYSHLFENFPQFVVIYIMKGFGIVNKAEADFFLDSFVFSMTQWMLAIWSLVPLPFLNPAWTSGSSQFTYYWSLAWRISSITLLACEMSAIVRVVWTFFGIIFLWDWNENWPFPVLWPLLIKLAGILSAALSQHHLLGFEIAPRNCITSTSFVSKDAS